MSRVAVDPVAGTRPSPVAALLDARPWAYRTQTFRALGFDFAIRVADPALGVYFDEVFSALVIAGEPAHLYSIVEREQRTRRRFAVFLDGRRTDSFESASAMLHYVHWHINRQVVDATTALCLHASAVAHANRAAVFVAPMDSGKSTIATALVRAGFDYLTDEAVAFDATGTIVPYPRPIALDPGSWPLFEELRPRPAPAFERYLARQWHLPPAAIRPGSVAEPCRATLIAKLRYDGQAQTSVVPIRRSLAFPWLIDQSFNFHRLGAVGLEQLATIVSGAQCVELTMNDLADTCATVRALLDEGPTP